METTTARDAEVREVGYPSTAPPSPRRRAYAATMVAGLYVLLVLGAPLIVRYGPDLPASAPATVTVRDAAAPRCASAPEFGNACQAGDTLATHKVLPAIPLH